VPQRGGQPHLNERRGPAEVLPHNGGMRELHPPVGIARRAGPVADLRARALLFLAGYCALTWISFVYPMRGSTITPWNPQVALAVGFLVLHPPAWPVVWIAVGVAEASVGGEPMRLPALVVASGALTAGYAVTAAALRRWAGVDLASVGRRAAAVGLAIMAAGALISSSLRAGALWAVGAVPFGRIPVVVHRASIGDGVGLLVTLPLLLVLATPAYRERTARMLRSPECWAIAAVAAIGVAGVFAQPPQEQFKFFYVLFLPVVWAAIRFGVVGAVWSAVLVQALLIVAVQTGQYQPLTVFELQVLMAALSATGILLGATVDERVAAEEALRASLRLAAAADMAAALAHELNQPLTAIGTYARASQLLARRLGAGTADASSIEDVANKLSSEAARAGEVVNRLRRFFREGSTELQPEDISELLRDAVQAQQGRADELQVRMVEVEAEMLPKVWVDRIQIAVVLRNLIANAIDAASDRTLPVEGRAVEIAADQRGDEIVVSVVDTGPGLSSDEARSVFETRRSAKPGGMGIGLTISRAIVDAHGGQLWAEPGRGGTFRFTLPIGTGGMHDA
jgi:two-component system, LuxR family, sensor kinase FixL